MSGLFLSLSPFSRFCSRRVRYIPRRKSPIISRFNSFRFMFSAAAENINRIAGTDRSPYDSSGRRFFSCLLLYQAVTAGEKRMGMNYDHGRFAGLSDKLQRAVNEEFAALNAQQRAAAMHDQGRALCIAGPGSGKTAVISRRAARLGLVRGGGPLQGRVLTLAFNRAACREMKNRSETVVRRICERAGLGPEASRGIKTDHYTIHGYCFKLVRDYCGGHGLKIPRVLEPDEEDRLIREAYREITGGNAGDVTVALFKDYCSGEMRVSLPSGDCKTVFPLVRERFSAVKKELCAVGFGDMLEEALRYLRADKVFRDTTVSAYDYVQVDEAQDLSEKQADVIGLISSGNVFFVADDDQSIYGFRGADPEVVRRLGEGAAIYMLETNYRSKSEITGAASRFIRSNVMRFPKNLTSDKGKGGRVIIKAFENEVSQAVFTVDRIIKYRREGRSVCVLYRNNAGAPLVLTLLYFAVSGARDRRGDGRITGVHITGEKTLLSEDPYAAALSASIIKAEEERRRMVRDAQKFRLPVEKVPLPKDVYKQLEKSGLVDVLGAETMAGRRKYYVENVKAALREIVERSVSGKEIMEHAAAVDAFGSGDGSSGVYMSTIHSAKGLEYDAVMIIDCVKGEFPFGSLSGDALSEERRLLYVAMTRAAGDLYITYPRRCGRLELLPGEFLEELKDCV